MRKCTDRWSLVGKLLLLIVLPGLFLSSLAAACSKPEKPPLPDVETAVIAEMMKAQRDVKKYVAEGNAYLECVKSDKDHNAMVDDMQALGKTFNKMIKQFKKRNKS